MTSLKKPLSRTVSTALGDIVVTLDDEGVSIRAAGKRKTVKMAYADIARLGLDRDGYVTTDEERMSPLSTLRSLRHRKRVSRDCR